MRFSRPTRPAQCPGEMVLVGTGVGQDPYWLVNEVGGAGDGLVAVIGLTDAGGAYGLKLHRAP